MNLFDLFFLLKSVHGPLAGFTFACVIISDLYGLSWILGYKAYLNKIFLKIMHNVVYFGLMGLILTGLGMIYIEQSYLQNGVFLVKLFFVFILFLNSFRIGKEIFVPSKKKFLELDKKVKWKMLEAGATSIVSWLAVFILIGMVE